MAKKYDKKRSGRTKSNDRTQSMDTSMDDASPGHSPKANENPYQGISNQNMKQPIHIIQSKDSLFMNQRCKSTIKKPDRSLIEHYRDNLRLPTAFGRIKPNAGHQNNVSLITFNKSFLDFTGHIQQESDTKYYF